ncbi:60S ribosomal protein L32, variant 2 [Entomophthora muscae]|uniref:60S ribosomal protein L32 n=3 Tax=Entomophthora muscae TaxID=34485 RepID=A0ACC2UAL4_9FUNG|nr:60S ribosomal protein L32 [Entomophthora muscae]KAJ9089617.1 60S ribosomal protein L32 [Entomophthora muscae]KAJ9089618.1 60S ribosomal protein L32, variant 2 [Entomophthora muscae]
MVASAKKIKIIKKHPKRFQRHQSDRYAKLKNSSWRKPKGIDNCVRRRFKGKIVMPNIGYGSDKRTKHMMPNGLKSFLIRCPADLELLLMHNDKYAAVLAAGLSSKSRIPIIERAAQLNIKVMKPNSRLRTEEK